MTKLKITAIALTVPLLSQGATSANQEASVFGNPLFMALLFIIVMLAIMVIALGSALKNYIRSEDFVQKIKKEKQAVNTARTVALLLFLLAGFTASSQNAAAPAGDSSIGGLDQVTFYSMMVIIFIELLAIGMLYKTFMDALRLGETKLQVAVKEKKAWSFFKKMNYTVEIERESEIMLDHSYDGIRELDNNLPPWWKYGFYLTILIAVFYLINYHITKTGPLQAEEYATSIKKAEAEIAEYMKSSANNVDENTVKLLTEAGDIKTGKDLFMTNCAACHGKSGEGMVGPNLTDDYWLHGGSISDVFKTIKYGWPDKGMKSWKEDFSPMQIAQLASFIRTFKGTNPSNPKEKQGELYVENEMKKDTVTVKKDTIKTLSTLGK